MHERPEGMDEGTLIMCGLTDDSILLSLEIVMEQFHKQGFRSRIVPDYNVGIVSQKVIRIILSYVDYINRVVWKK